MLLYDSFSAADATEGIRNPRPIATMLFPSFRGVLWRSAEVGNAAAKWEDNFAEPGQTFDAATPFQRCFPAPFFPCFITRNSLPPFSLTHGFVLYFRGILSGPFFRSARRHPSRDGIWLRFRSSDPIGFRGKGENKRIIFDLKLVRARGSSVLVQ